MYSVPIRLYSSNLFFGRVLWGPAG
jgi:hypothetical protein